MLTAIAPSVSAAEAQLQEIAYQAAALPGVSACLLAFASKNEPVFAAGEHTGGIKAPMESALFTHAIASPDRTTTIKDAKADTRFATDSLVRGPPDIRLFIGVPVKVLNQPIGVLSVISQSVTDSIDEEMVKRVEGLATLASRLIELSDSDLHRSREQSEHQQSVERHSLAAKAAGIGSSLWYPETAEIEADVAFCTFHGIEPTNPLPMSRFFEIIAARDRDRVRRAVEDALNDSGELNLEYRTHSEDRWILTQGQRLAGKYTNSQSTLACVSIDISETKQGELTTRLLLRELNHRVKNTLAVLHSLAGQTMRHSDNPHSFMRAFLGRLQALAAAHTLVSERRWGQIDVTMLLRAVMTTQLPLFDEVVDISGANAFLPPDEGVALALVVNELTTNAMRHGSLSVAGGGVSIHIDSEGIGNRTVRIIWSEHDGPEVPEKISRNLGLNLIERGLQKNTGSKVELDFRPEGLVAQLTIPVGAATSVEPELVD